MEGAADNFHKEEEQRDLVRQITLEREDLQYRACGSAASMGPEVGGYSTI